MLKAFAEDLKSIREEKNISLRDISNKTRINISILENLETGEYNFQPQAYIRAFLKQYLAAIGLDVEEELFEYDLARSGKYKPKRQNISVPLAEIFKKEEETGARETKSNLTEKLKEIVETPKRKTRKKKSEKPLTEERTDAFPLTKDSGIRDFTFKKTENKYSINPNSDTKIPSSNPVTAKKLLSFSFLSSPLFRNILMILIVCLVLLGLYSLINILFLEGGNNNPEVIRQNFDDVVKEQESKFLGKRTPEEIQDSIKKVAEDIIALKDSITLKIVSTAPGIIFIVRDSINYNRPIKIQYDENETGVFKAGKSFHISSTNTGTFKATLNNNPIKFNNKSVSKFKVTKSGAVK